MAKRIAWLIVRAEDLNQVNFARRYLGQKGHHLREIRKPRRGRGAAEQYVREKYADEVGEYRSRSSYESAALVVLVDADMRTVLERENELEAALANAGEDRRRPEEAIVLLIPKRHIETWILYLLGERVDEFADYRSRRDIPEKIKPAAQKFYEWARPDYQLPDHCVDSLRRGLVEVRRIP